MEERLPPPAAPEDGDPSPPNVGPEVNWRSRMARVRAPTPNNLPANLTTFVGREREIAEVTRLLAAARLVTLTGTGGCGKSRLAVEAARGLQRDFPDGVRAVELAALSEATLVPYAVAGVLEVPEHPGTPMVATLGRASR